MSNNLRSLSVGFLVLFLAWPLHAQTTGDPSPRPPQTVSPYPVELEVLEQEIEAWKRQLNVRADFQQDSTWFETVEQARDFSAWPERAPDRPDPHVAKGKLVFAGGWSLDITIFEKGPKVTPGSGSGMAAEGPATRLHAVGNGLSVRSYDIAGPKDFAAPTEDYLWPALFFRSDTDSGTLGEMRNIEKVSPIFILDLDYQDTYFLPHKERGDLNFEVSAPVAGQKWVHARSKSDGRLFTEWKFDTTQKYPRLIEASEFGSYFLIGEREFDQNNEIGFPKEIRFVLRTEGTRRNQEKSVSYRVKRWRFSNIQFGPPQPQDFTLKMSGYIGSGSGYRFDQPTKTVNLLELDPAKLIPSQTSSGSPTLDSPDRNRSKSRVPTSTKDSSAEDKE